MPNISQLSRLSSPVFNSGHIRQPPSTPLCLTLGLFISPLLTTALWPFAVAPHAGLNPSFFVDTLGHTHSPLQQFKGRFDDREFLSVTMSQRKTGDNGTVLLPLAYLYHSCCNRRYVNCHNLCHSDPLFTTVLIPTRCDLVLEIPMRLPLFARNAEPASNRHEQIIPEKSANIFDRLTFGWVFPVLKVSVARSAQ